MSETKCRWAGSDQPRQMPDGEPCPERHCAVCGIQHVTVEGRGTDQTCIDCLRQAREDLGQIVRLCGKLPKEVEHRGVQSEAANLLGPAVDPEQRGHVLASIAAGRLPADWLDVADDERHPLFVLGTIDMLWRDALAHDEPNERLTVTKAAAYVGQHLTRMAQNEHLPFGDVAGDLRRCRAHIESVLHDGEQVEQGAPCLKCHRPVTRSVTDQGEVRYRCNRCRDDLSDNQYRLAIRAAHVMHADRLNLSDLSERIDVEESTLRRWANVRRIQRVGEEPVEYPPLMRPCGKDGTKRLVYRVKDAEAIRDGGGDRRGSGTVSIARGA